MKRHITITKGTPKDIPAFLQYFRTSMPILFPQYTANSVGFLINVDYNPEWLTKTLKKGGKKMYLAKDNEKIIGYILFASSICGVGYADWLGVDKKYQKQGIASQLLALWEENALEDGAHNLYLWTWEHNTSFYSKRGFIQGGIFPKGWCGQDCYLMYKLLREPEEKNYLKRYLQKIKKG